MTDLNKDRLKGCVDFVLRGAGSANIVIGFTRENIRLVWRFKKLLLTDGKRHDECISVQDSISVTQQSRSDFELFYLKSVIAPFFASSRYIVFPVPVAVSVQELRLICDSIYDTTTDSLSKCQFHEEFALEMPDLTFLQEFPHDDSPVFAVEIKPKQGFISPSSTVHRPVLTEYCSNCLIQYLKYRSGLHPAFYHYCPIDLFSDCEQKVRLALTNLLSCSNNHLKIFKNGQRIVDQDRQLAVEQLDQMIFDGIIDPTSKLDNFVDVLLSMLRFDHDDTPTNDGSTAFVSQRNAGILQALLLAQQCDDVGPLAAASLIIKHRQRYATRKFFADPDDNSQLFDDDQLHGLCANDRNDLYRIRHALIAATLRDCSIMITFKVIDRQHLSIMSERENHMKQCSYLLLSDSKVLAFRTSLLDLDPKSPKKLLAYCDRLLKAADLVEEHRKIGLFTRNRCQKLP